jgi:N-acetylglutamate synthase-like GNAT family acetyltransferase
MSITIRSAVETDQDEIKSMVREARINPRNLHWSRFLVAEEGGRIVGIRQVKIHKDGTREVASGVVRPEYRRRGISAKLMHAILARKLGPLYLMCDQKWSHYYEQFGFLRVDPLELPPDFRKEYRTGRIITSVLSLLARRDIRLIPMKRER